MKQKTVFLLIVCIFLALVSIAFIDIGSSGMSTLQYETTDDLTVTWYQKVFQLISLKTTISIIGVILVVVLFKINLKQPIKVTDKNNYGDGSDIEPLVIVPDHSVEVIKAIQFFDDTFNSGDFITKAKSSLLDIHHSITKKDSSIFPNTLDDEFMCLLTEKINNFVTNGTTQFYEDVSIKEIYFYKYKRKEVTEEVVVLVQVNLIDYIKKDSTDELIDGSMEKLENLQFLMTFSRQFNNSHELNIENEWKVVDLQLVTPETIITNLAVNIVDDNDSSHVNLK